MISYEPYLNWSRSELASEIGRCVWRVGMTWKSTSGRLVSSAMHCFVASYHSPGTAFYACILLLAEFAYLSCILQRLVFLPRDAMLRCVLPSVCLSHADIVAKWLDVGSCRHRYTIAQRLCGFPMPKILMKFCWGHPKGRQMQVGTLKLTIFDLQYLAVTMQNRDIATIES